MSVERYRPSREELQKAEDSMTKEQADFGRERLGRMERSENEYRREVGVDFSRTIDVFENIIIPIAMREAQDVGKQGYSPKRRAEDVIKTLEKAELILRQPEGDLDKEYIVAEMAAVLHKALDGASAQHITSQKREIIADADSAMRLLISYIQRANIPVDHYLIRENP